MDHKAKQDPNGANDSHHSGPVAPTPPQAQEPTHENTSTATGSTSGSATRTPDKKTA